MASEFKNKISAQKTSVFFQKKPLFLVFSKKPIFFVFSQKPNFSHFFNKKLSELARNSSILEEENYNLKVKLQESLDLYDETNGFFEPKLREYEKIVPLKSLVRLK